MKVDLDNSKLHKGKILIEAKDVNFSYNDKDLWKQPFTFEITSGERIAVKGSNGVGKTTFIRLILGEMQPSKGVLKNASVRWVYVDQDYSLINKGLTVYELAQEFNKSGLQEHDIKIRLNRFLFSTEYWDKPCGVLSGGEKMRLLLCALTIGSQAPDIIILDEPTNNLDIQNLEILRAAVNEYKGTLIVVSHDEYFLKEINIERDIFLR